MRQRKETNSPQEDGAAAPAQKAPAPPFVLHPTTVVQMFVGVLATVGESVFALDSSSGSKRGGIFLLAFTVVHVIGNMTFFGGREAFNGYAVKLMSLPLFFLVEYYLLAGGVVHVLAGTFRTVKYKLRVPKKNVASGLWTNLRLALTGTVVLAFVCTHLLDFRLNHAAAKLLPAAEDGGKPVMDLYGLQLDVFRSQGKTAWYVFAVLCLGVHLYYGWPKSVLKFKLDKQYTKPVTALGHLLILPVCTGFIACAVAAHRISAAAPTAAE